MASSPIAIPNSPRAKVGFTSSHASGAPSEPCLGASSSARSAARGTRNAGSRRAGRIRAPRHVRPALRRDRSNRRALPDRGKTAREPRTPPGAGSGDGSRRRSHSPASSCRRLPRCRARRRLRQLLAVLDPNVVLRADRAAVQAGASSEARGARRPWQ
jgi:hypothetical protein